MRIFIYSGSCNPQSTTRAIAKELVKRIEEEIPVPIIIDEYAGNCTQIEECIGCTCCFANGKCVLDQKDDMALIREKILAADCIIFGSPVYFHGVSGNMKKFMDRLSFWTHTMELAGKLGITIATSGGNGLEYVSEYLNKFMDYLGILHVGDIQVATYNMVYMREYHIMDDIQDNLKECARKLRNYVVDGKIPHATKLQNDIFCMNNSNFKKLVEYQDDIAEVKRWIDRDYFQYPTFESVILEMYHKA